MAGLIRTVVALDIGATAVRGAEFRVGRNQPSLRRFASVELARGVVTAGSVTDGEALTQALRELWTRGRFGTKSVALGLANASILVRQMDLEWMAPADFRQALRYQVQDALPMPVDDANLDYHVLEELELPAENGQTRRVLRVLLVAAARENVDAFAGAVSRAGLRPVSADVIPFALVRAVRGQDKTASTPEAIVDIGFDTIKVVVHQGGQPRYVRMIPSLGSDTITRSLQEQYGWTWDEAERTKVKAALPGHADLDAPQATSGGLDHPAQRTIAAQADVLVAEIRATLDYLHDGSEGSLPLARVLLTGAGARLGGLPELLASGLGLPVEPLTPQDRVHTPRRLELSDHDRSALTVLAGLCTGASR